MLFYMLRLYSYSHPLLQLFSRPPSEDRIRLIIVSTAYSETVFCYYLVAYVHTVYIHTNTIAPVAATRMTEDLIPESAQATLGPELVTPAVVYLCTEDAPNGVILQAQGGQYSIACIVENAGVNLGANASVEDIADNYEKITDLTGAKPRGMLQLNQM